MNIRVLQLNSWLQYKHLFSSDFDEDEWGAINDFYTNAALLDQTLTQSNAVFESNAEQIRSNMQRVLADLVEVMVAQTNQDSFEQDLKQLNERAELFSDLYEKKKNDFAYTPVKYLNDVKKILEDINLLSTSTAGERLKKLAGRKRS